MTKSLLIVLVNIWFCLNLTPLAFAGPAYDQTCQARLHEIIDEYIQCTSKASTANVNRKDRNTGDRNITQCVRNYERWYGEALEKWADACPSLKRSHHAIRDRVLAKKRRTLHPSPRFGIYLRPLSLNAGTPSLNGTLNGNSAHTLEEVNTIIDNVIDQIQGSPGKYQFTDIFLWLFGFPTERSPFVTDHPHVLTWNGIPITPLIAPSGQLWELSPTLPDKFQELRSVGINLLVSLGGWEGSGVFGTIREIGVQSFVTYLEENFFIPYHVNGVNLDLEGAPDLSWFDAYQQHSQTIVDLSNEIASRGYVVTHTPANGLSTSFYVDSCPGLPNNQPILEATYNGGTQSISYLNVQYYAGGNAGNTPKTVADYEALVHAVQIIGSQTGITNAEHFIMAGFWPIIGDPQHPAGRQPLKGGDPQTQVVVLEVLKGLSAKYPKGIGGAFQWIYEYYNRHQKGYANQIRAWTKMTQAIRQRVPYFNFKRPQPENAEGW